MEIDIRKLRNWSAKLCGYNPPTHEIPEGGYNSHESGGLINTETNVVYSMEEWNRGFYYTDKNGKPLAHGWYPDDPKSGQIWEVVKNLPFKLEIILGCLHNNFFARIYSGKYRKLLSDVIIDENPCLAILKAAYITMEEIHAHSK